MTVLSKKSLLFFCSFSFFVTTSCFGVDLQLLTNYRENGIQNLEKELDSQLTQTDYWSAYLQNVDTSFGYYESYSNLLICDKSKSQLTLYKKDQNSSSFQLKKEYSAYTGKMRGDKAQEGDLKTPVGVYNLVKKLTDVDSFYGPLAFVTSYPNIYDKYKGKTGQGIWIHGLPLHQDRETFTKGCIAIKNKSIECLSRNIDIKKTLLIIDENIFPQNSITKEKYAKILADIFAWRYTWRYNDLEKYLSFYAPEFKRFDGMDIKRFSHYKKRIFQRNEKKTIIFKDINIIPYPNHKDTFKILFKEQYRSKNFTFNGEKTLIIKFTDNKFQIITEK